MELFDAALASGEPGLIPIELDLKALRSPEQTAPALLRTLVRAPRRRAAAATGSSWAERTAALPPADRRRAAGELVRATVAAVLGLAGPAAVNDSGPFIQLGMDSLTGMELRRRLASDTGIAVPATAVFDHPTPGALTDFVLAELARIAGEAAARPSPDSAAATTTGIARDDDPIVIVGMACRYPGDTRSPDDLWQLVADGVDAIGARPLRSTRSSACCWRPPGRASSRRASTRPPCAAAAPECSSAPCTTTTPPGCPPSRSSTRAT